MGRSSRMAEILSKHHSDILSEWLKLQREVITSRPDLMKETELRNESAQFLRLFMEAAQSGASDITSPAWSATRDMLAALSASRAKLGFSTSETAMFVFSLKEPIFSRLRHECGADAETLASEIWGTMVLLDKLGLYTTEVFQKSREEIITRQQQEMLELSTPVVQLWDGILALPIIGTLDSARTQVVMQNLLQRIVETGSDVAIIDITGVPVVDTLVAQHLLKTVAAARLMGGDCIISGIRPQIAQTIVHLGVELGDIVTKATLADAFAVAMQRTGLAITTRTQAKS
jgi:rsbT co-antagonist protein RsbR